MWHPPGRYTPYFCLLYTSLILKGTNQSFDTLTTDAVKKDYSFTLLEATYLERTGLRFEPSDYVSFGLADKKGVLTWLLYTSYTNVRGAFDFDRKTG